MKILMLTSLVGPNTNLRKGGIYDIKNKEAKQYIKAKVARELTDIESQIHKLKVKEAEAKAEAEA